MNRFIIIIIFYLLSSCKLFSINFSCEKRHQFIRLLPFAEVANVMPTIRSFRSFGQAVTLIQPSYPSSGRRYGRTLVADAPCQQ